MTAARSLAAHANDREIWLNLRDRFPYPYSVQDAESYIASLGDRAQLTSFGIEVDGEAAGTIGVIPGTDIGRYSAEIGYWLGRRFWNHGVVTQALLAVTDYAFSELKMLRVFAVPFAENTASHRVLAKAGYELEGRMRNSAMKNSELLDQLLYAAYKPPTVTA